MSILRIAIAAGRWDLAAHALVYATARKLAGGKLEAREENGTDRPQISPEFKEAKSG